ncbi:MAG: flippase-like domain-containing protein [Flavobacteriaceae bacterium]|nr:flippase-like domain-containing protein [Flavobacteriaceae bacterium]
MFGALSHKTKQLFFLLIKTSIVICAIYFIYLKLTRNKHLKFETFTQVLLDHNVFSLQNIVVLLGLTAVNWYFEILKWQHLVAAIKSISFKEAGKQTLAALTASLITPNRVGEYGFKAFYFRKTLAKKVMLLTLLGNIAQMSITILFGVIGLYFLVLNHNIAIRYTQILQALILGISTAILIILLLKNIKIFQLESILHFITEIPKKIPLKIMSFSLIRYLVFSFQFYILLIMFDVDVSYLNALIIISSMYLLASIIPSIAIFDVFVKGSIALFLFGLIGVNTITVLSCVTLMWILNFVLPSILGGVYVLEFNTASLFDTNTKT